MNKLTHPSTAISSFQHTPSAPLARVVLWLLLALVFVLLFWSAFGQLDIVAVAEGKLVPQSYLKIVQPVEQGIVKEILVGEGEAVRQGQVLMRMDAVASDADNRLLQSQLQRHLLAFRRIDAELSEKPLSKQAEDDEALFNEMLAQYTANRQASQSALDEQTSVLEKARQDMAAASEIKTKLEQVLPHYREQEKAYAQLGNDGFAGKLLVAEKQRERIEQEQDLKSQVFVIKSAKAATQQAQKRMAQLRADTRRQLQAERVQTAAQLDKLQQELVKQEHREALLELRAPQDGIVKDLATHTVGTVVAPGTVLLTLVPKDESLMAEVWVSNEDIGFVRPNQPVKLKLGAFTFQKYGMVQGTVEQVSADASEPSGQEHNDDLSGRRNSRLAYKARIALNSQRLVAGGQAYPLSPGMQVSAEILLGNRSVLEYLLSPIRGAFHEAARER